ncbi:acyl-CoA dehydrogenase family protein [Paralimibaculum aggregatum]|uniref:Acyl-CoA dehydrogenase family protein n=1 Tax=Paralimibaculum aggregatum TaxID=3036245 RepID=A0ABQ6LFI6_9RHOB|nr:acyl-CoA dehydrogenase family protein [Limibaculum sp. NKW23]GMG82099.1 acyl-CoA dehydrogenase family protein [Limibaculum sp. NKW23]
MLDDTASGAWELPEEFVLLRETVRRFMADEVRPLEERQPHDAYALPEDALRQLQAKAKALGLWCLASPAEYGGGGLNLLGQVVVAEEAAKCRMGAYVPACGALGIDPPSVIWLGNEAQKQKYGVEGIARGKKCFVAISEAAGGSDPGRKIQTRAVRDGDHYVMNGTKMWITAAGNADWGIVFARTGEAGKGGGITAFILDAGTPGMSAREIGVIRSYSPYEMVLEDVRVPVENRLGEEGRGFEICQKWLVHARVPYAAGVIGVAQEALRIATEWARGRHVHKSLLADKQAVQWMIADSEIELRAARLLTYQAAWNGDLGRDIKTDASIAKVYATETAGRVIDRCVQILGAMGVARELPLERWYRELRIKRIGEGPSEVHRMVLSRELLRE